MHTPIAACTHTCAAQPGRSLSRAEACELLLLAYPGLTKPQLRELVPHGITREGLQQLLINAPPAGVSRSPRHAAVTCLGLPT